MFGHAGIHSGRVWRETGGAVERRTSRPETKESRGAISERERERERERESVCVY